MARPIHAGAGRGGCTGRRRFRGSGGRRGRPSLYRGMKRADVRKDRGGRLRYRGEAPPSPGERVARSLGYPCSARSGPACTTPAPSCAGRCRAELRPRPASARLTVQARRLWPRGGSAISPAMTPATDWKEVVTPGEEERFERYAKELRAIQHRRAHGGPASRALHAKANLGVEAELTVLPDLPEHAAMGLFATPATYRAYVRFSNGSGKRQPDEVPDVRGMAIKVVGVDGKKIIPGMEDAKTQDFLAIRTPSTPFSNADEFVKLVLAAENPVLLPIRVLLDNGLSRGLTLLKALMGALKVAMTPLAATSYYSALPIKYGPYAVHYALFPHASPYELPPPSPEYLGDELAARLRREPVVYDLRVQFFKDERATPIEDGSVEWREQ